MYEQNVCREKVYFYCSTATFEKIIGTKKIWLCDMSKTSDSGEIRYVYDALCENLVEVAEYFTNEKEANVIISKLKSQCDRFLYNYYCMATCFSSANNDLGMWRCYGENGKGFSIGFDKDLLMKFAESENLVFKQIGYGEKARKSFISFSISCLCSELKKISVLNESGNGLNGKANDIVRQWVGDFFEKIAFYKNDAFASEQEYRLCYAHKLYEEPKSDDVSIHDSLYDKDEQKLALGFHSKEDGIVMHLEKEFPDELITDITIGYQNRTTEKTLKMFLSKCSFDYKKIQVFESVITHRTN